MDIFTLQYPLNIDDIANSHWAIFTELGSFSIVLLGSFRTRHF